MPLNTTIKSHWYPWIIINPPFLQRKSETSPCVSCTARRKRLADNGRTLRTLLNLALQRISSGGFHGSGSEETHGSKLENLRTSQNRMEGIKLHLKLVFFHPSNQKSQHGFICSRSDGMGFTMVMDVHLWSPRDPHRWRMDVRGRVWRCP